MKLRGAWWGVVGLLLAGVSGLSIAAERRVYVLNAIDGDQLELLPEGGKQHRAFMAGITAPVKDTQQAKASKLALSSLAFGRWVQAACQNAPAPPPGKANEKPKPGPLYCRVEVEGVDLAVAQLEAGQARYSVKHAVGLNAEQRQRYADAEAKAKAAKAGLWATAP